MSTGTDVVHHQQPLAPMTPAPAQQALLQTETFNQMWRVATAMARSALCPKHLRGNNGDETAANCLRVVNQAYRWGFDPFAVADESYVVGGKLGYQGKLVAAVINARAGLAKRLNFTHAGAGLDRTVTVSGTFVGEDEPKTIELSVKQAKTDNKIWHTDPDQKLCYSGAIKWARRWCPELIMGVLTDDDLEKIAGPVTDDGPIEAGAVVSSLDQLAAKVEAQHAPAEPTAAAPEHVDAGPAEPVNAPAPAVEEPPEHSWGAAEPAPEKAPAKTAKGKRGDDKLFPTSPSANEA